MAQTPSQKRGDFIGYSGHKHQTGEKVITIVDKNGYVIAPLAAAPVNEADMILLPNSVKLLKTISQALNLTLAGTVFNLDAGFDSKKNRRIIQQLKMKPNIKENPRNRTTNKPGSKRFFDTEIYKLRFVIERTFGWEDNFRRLLIRWEHIHQRHLSFHTIAFTLINLRPFLAI